MTSHTHAITTFKRIKFNFLPKQSTNLDRNNAPPIHSMNGSDLLEKNNNKIKSKIKKPIINNNKIKSMSNQKVINDQ